MAKQASEKETDSKKTSATKVKEKVKEKAAEVKEVINKKTESPISKFRINPIRKYQTLND